MLLVAYLLILHFVADFLLQTRRVATKKSKDPFYLGLHLLTVFAVFAIGTAYFGWRGLAFSAPNAAFHGVIDWNIWRLYKWVVRRNNPTALASSWRYWEDYGFYTTIGLDQLLHSLVIIALAWRHLL